MWFRLALAMGCSVRHTQAMVSSREFTEWLIYFGVEPFGEERADLRAGIIAATVANTQRTRGQRLLKPADFMPRFQPTPRRMPAEKIKAAFLMASAALTASKKAKRNAGA